ncbi:hypothetical protein KI387_003288, partial [Taxus chinensis]
NSLLLPCEDVAKSIVIGGWTRLDVGMTPKVWVALDTREGVSGLGAGGCGGNGRGVGVGEGDVEDVVTTTL